VVFYETLRTDVGVLADLRARQYDAILPDSRAIADAIGVHVRRFVNRVAHT
jgi:hypothetical protein